MGKVKAADPYGIALHSLVYQFPMGKVKAADPYGIALHSLGSAQVSIPYGKGKDNIGSYYISSCYVSIPYGKGKARKKVNAFYTKQKRINSLWER